MGLRLLLVLALLFDAIKAFGLVWDVSLSAAVGYLQTERFSTIGVARSA
jgi:hypothetical protein